MENKIKIQQTENSVIIKKRTYRVPKRILVEGVTIKVVDDEVYYNGYHLNKVTGGWHPATNWREFREK